jgi:acyl-CoA synthetase (AMP-forming)/AMP-acid ligase II
VVGAVVVPAHGAQPTVEAVVAHARANLSGFKVPTVVAVVDERELPMLPTGKVDRRTLARLLSTD